MPDGQALSSRHETSYHSEQIGSAELDGNRQSSTCVEKGESRASARDAPTFPGIKIGRVLRVISHDVF